MLWGITGLFFVLTVIFLAGKGSFLIAGYNTAGKKQKERYDEKKLCRLMGGCMGIITISLAAGAFYGENMPGYLSYAFVIVVIADVLVTVILANTVCCRKDKNGAAQESPEEKRKNQKLQRISFALTAGIFIFVGIMLTTGNIKVNMNKESMEIEGSYWPDMEISWDKIQSVTYMENLQAGSRIGGLGSLRLQEGSFENSEFGAYTRYTYVKCKKYVVMETTAGVLVVNQKTEKETEELYGKIRSGIFSGMRCRKM